MALIAASFLSAAHAADRVELPMRQRGAQPMVDVMVNGRGPFRFAIDTGGQGKARADVKLVEKLKLAKVGEARAGDPSGKNLVTLDIVRMDSLKIGTLEFKDVDAPSRDYNRGPSEAIDGVLGFQLFAEHLLTLDYANKKVIIETGALGEQGEGVVKFAAPRGIPVVPITIAGKPAHANIDTGNLVAPFLLPGELAASLPMLGDAKVVGQARTVANTFEIKEAQLDGDIVLGKWVSSKPEVRYPAPGRDANIGSLAFEGKVITFDQKNGLLRIVAAR